MPSFQPDEDRVHGPLGHILESDIDEPVGDRISVGLPVADDLEEAEQLVDRIAILHRGRIIANDTLAGLKRMLPPKKKEYVEKQPSLDDIFFALTGYDEPGNEPRESHKSDTNSMSNIEENR